ncbi:hypothetical protein BJ875DRAFT_261549 [Amylocarpus encephaloides]|uniref:Uncharacterized protein n=1 Tax=Amylocarpus encephaloides TaxID=45428 RepID=A0A9P7YTA6_9HELO|nr:hypothetical protein BJ875DRAFT_261549 [Amylocarpus encephaloides]
MSAISKLARVGSHASASSTLYAATSLSSPLPSPTTSNGQGSSIDTSSHHHFISNLRPSLTSWLHEAWAPINHRHERLALGSPTRGMSILSRESMEMQNLESPEVRGMMDCLPVAEGHRFVGWRRKLGTWPLSKSESLSARQFAA